MKSLNDIRKSITEFNIKPTPQMRSRVLDEALALQQKRTRPSTPGMNIWRIIMKSTKFSTAAAVLILAVVGLYHLIGPGAGTAFANAMEHLASARTARFDISIEFGEQEPQVSGFLYDTKGYLRQNMANGTVNYVDYNTNKVLSMVPDANTVFIRNVNKPDLNTALYDVFTNLPELIQQVIDLGSGPVEPLGQKIINSRPANGYHIESFDEIVESIDAMPELFWPGRGTLTIWADAETDFPVMLIWHNTMANATVTVSNIQLNVIFEPDELSITIPEGFTIQDETLPPAEPKSDAEKSLTEAASTQQQETPISDDSADIGISDLVEGLDENDRTLIKCFYGWTVLTNGKFPSSLTTDAFKDIDPDAKLSLEQKGWSFSFSAGFDASRLFGDEWKAGIDPNDYTAEEKEQLKQQRGRYYEDLQAAFNKAFEGITPYFSDVFKGFEMINKLPARSDWHYNGAGIELGDADTAIFRYVPKGSTLYRVIYGDLTIRDAAPEDLPLPEAPSPEEIDQNAKNALETAIQLGADIPEDDRAIVLRMLSLKEDDLIKGLATYLEFSGGTYPPTLSFNEDFVKHLDTFLDEPYKQHALDEKQSRAKTLDISFAAFYYDKLMRQKKEPAYYGDRLTVDDADKVLVRWKISKDRYRVVFVDLTRETVTAEDLSELETAALK